MRFLFGFITLRLRTSQWKMILFHNRDTWEGERAEWGTKQLNLLKVELFSLLVKPHYQRPFTQTQRQLHLQKVLAKFASFQNNWELTHPCKLIKGIFLVKWNLKEFSTFNSETVQKLLLTSQMTPLSSGQQSFWLLH